MSKGQKQAFAFGFAFAFVKQPGNFLVSSSLAVDHEHLHHHLVREIHEEEVLTLNLLSNN